jgi:zinc transport system ATP-binding protein
MHCGTTMSETPNSKEPPVVIKLENVSFAYQNQPILEGVNFSIKDGEFIGIFGPNGGGKTTLLKLLMGFLKPASGTVQIMGKPPREVQSQIAYVPQTLRFDKQFPITVWEVILSGRLAHLPWHGRYCTEDEARAEKMMQKMGLSHLCNQAFGSLSGGQSQRTLIARALVSDPQILLLDEPTASVDAQAENEIYKIFEDLKGHITILMVTHHLRTAIHQVERVLCVNKTIISLKPEAVCEHFAVGLYHAPLITESN